MSAKDWLAFNVHSHFILDIMTRMGPPLDFTSSIPPPDRMNLVIEYFKVNLAHLFAMMVFLPPF